MEDLKAVARLARWGAEDTAHQLDFIPDDKLDWKPVEGFKSALDIVAEVVFVTRYGMPIFEGKEMQEIPMEKPADREQAKRMLRETFEAYAAALENAGQELEKTVMTPGGPMAGTRAALYSTIELLHHHGQIAMLQALLGDNENHMSPEAMQAFAAA